MWGTALEPPWLSQVVQQDSSSLMVVGAEPGAHSRAMGSLEQGRGRAVLASLVFMLPLWGQEPTPGPGGGGPAGTGAARRSLSCEPLQ